MADEKKSTKRVEADPSLPVAKEEFEAMNSIFVDPNEVQKVLDAMTLADPGNRDEASVFVMRAVIHLAALGIPNAMIAKNLRVKSHWVNAIVGSIGGAREIERLQIKHFARDVEAMTKRLVPAAVQKIFDLMLGTGGVKASTQLEAAKYIVDRAHGKPKERHEVQSDMLADVFKQLREPKEISSQVDVLEASFSEVPSTGGSSAGDPLEKIMGDKS